MSLTVLRPETKRAKEQITRLRDLNNQPKVQNATFHGNHYPLASIQGFTFLGSLPEAAACAVSGFGFEVDPSFPGLG